MTIGGNCAPRASCRPGAIEENVRSRSKNKLEGKVRWRKAAWEKVVAANGGLHPNCGVADTRLLHRARLSAVPATRGGGLHPNREVWVRHPREATRSGFVPKNKHRPEAEKIF